MKQSILNMPHRGKQTNTFLHLNARTGLEKTYSFGRCREKEKTAHAVDAISYRQHWKNLNELIRRPRRITHDTRDRTRPDRHCTLMIGQMG